MTVTTVVEKCAPDEFAELFADVEECASSCEEGYASVCLPDDSPVFAETIATIAETCENFVAPA